MKTIQEKFPVIITGIMTLLLVVILYFFQLPGLKKIELGLYDFLLSRVEQSEPSGIVSIVDIDEKSLSQFGQWPWPRYKIAELLEKLKQLNALSIGIDFIFAEPDRTSLKQIRKDFQSSYHLPVSLDNIPEQFQDNDYLMSKTLGSGSFVLAYSFVFKQLNTISNNQKENKLHPLNSLYLYDKNAKKNSLDWFQAEDVVNNIPLFSKAVNASGFINIRPDNDGIIRKVPLLIKYQNQLFPGLSLATLMKAINSRQIVVKVSQNGLDSILLDEQNIPLDKYGNFWIHFRKQDKPVFQTISAADILNDKISADQLSNHIVLFGTSAKGLHDLISTPYKAIVPGVEIHASIIDNILRGDFISIPTWALASELSLIIVCALLSISIIIFSNVIIRSITTVLLITLLLVANWWWLNQGIYLSVFYAVLVVLLNFIVLSVFQARFKEKKLMKQTIELNMIQESAISMLKNANIDLEQNTNTLEQKIEDKSKQLSQAFEALNRSNQEITDSLKYAARIQNSLLPQTDISSYFKESFVIWEPRDKVGGDIYFTSQTKNGYVVAVIDCTGHGVPGALLSMIAIASLKQIISVEEIEIPSIILKKLNYSVKTSLGQKHKNEGLDDGMEISLCFINAKEQQLHYSGAGLPLVIINNNQLKLVKADKQKIGYRQTKNSDINFEFTEHIFALDESNSCYLFTDGIIDQPGGKKSFPFGKKRLTRLLLENHKLSAELQKSYLIDNFLTYMGKQNRRDDITIIGFKTNSSENLSQPINQEQ